VRADDDQLHARGDERGLRTAMSTGARLDPPIAPSTRTSATPRSARAPRPSAGKRDALDALAPRLARSRAVRSRTQRVIWDRADACAVRDRGDLAARERRGGLSVPVSAFPTLRSGDTSRTRASARCARTRSDLVGDQRRRARRERTRRGQSGA
jgi:hypothetical protein